MPHRPGLAPATADVRRAVREALVSLHGETVIVAVSGGADSLALAAAAAFEARAAKVTPHAVIVDHALQPDSGAVAQRAADTVRALGLGATVVRVDVRESGAGLEAAARAARRDALRTAATERGAAAIVLGHTLDDQAETVLLGLARGSGAASLAGMASDTTFNGARWIRPLLGIRRETTHAACAAEGLAPWDDPHNHDSRFRRVRVRDVVLPTLEKELGPGIAEALARTAVQLQEDADAFQDMIDETIEDIVEPADAGIAVSVPALAANPAAIRNRIIRHVVASEFGVALTRGQTVEVARLVTDWSGQGPIDLPACEARRSGNRLLFTAS